MELWLVAANAFWLVAPAYAANAFPPLVRGKKPVDFGLSFRGKRIFGDGKTIEGSLAGILFGLLIGSVQLFFQPFLLKEITPYGYFIELSMVLIFLLSLGAIAGDMAGSFVKRRLNINRGESAPVLDQLDFIAGSVILASFLVSIPVLSIVFIVIITPLVHYIANVLGFFLKIKKHPW